jgi:3-polyprenyl-4-hydroxybenzoate decarboxylase
MTSNLPKFYENTQKADKDTQKVVAKILNELNVKIDELQNNKNNTKWKII